MQKSKFKLLRWRGSPEFISPKLQATGAVGILLNLEAESQVKHVTRWTILTQEMIWEKKEPAPLQSTELFIRIGGVKLSKISVKS